MSVAVLAPVVAFPDALRQGDDRARMNPRTRRLLHGPILPTLLRHGLAEHPGDAGAGRPPA